MSIGNQLPDEFLRIIKQLLNTNGLLTNWTVRFVSETDAPHNQITLNEVDPVLQGRYAYGPYHKRRGFNLRVRNNGYEAGKAKAESIHLLFEETLTYPYDLNVGTNP